MKRVLLVLAWFVYFSGSDKYPEPIYYTVYETENVIIKYSREIYHDIYGVQEKTLKQVNKRFKNKTKDQIEYESILRVRTESYQKIKESINETK